MAGFLKQHGKTILLYALVGLVGGYFTGLYLMDSYPEQIRQELLAQGMDSAMLAVAAALQSAGYGMLFGALGIWLSQKVGLWKREIRLEKGPLLSALAVSVTGGLALILLDVFVFGRYVQAIADSYLQKPTVAFILASVSYGAVIEEVMIRLFVMSLIAYLLHKVFGKGGQTVSAAVLVWANVLSALLFAAGHLPTTSVMMGLSPVILIRCFLLNGGIGLLLGRLYRKYGLHYAMLAHGGCHIVSKMIWLLFI